MGVLFATALKRPLRHALQVPKHTTLRVPSLIQSTQPKQQIAPLQLQLRAAAEKQSLASAARAEPANSLTKRPAQDPLKFMLAALETLGTAPLWVAVADLTLAVVVAELQRSVLPPLLQLILLSQLPGVAGAAA